MNPQRTAHGLSLEPVVADWPALHESDIEQLLRDYPQLGPLHSLHWHSPRPFSAAGLITTRDATLFIKRHHRQVRQAAWLEEEHRLIAHLHHQGAPVAALVPNRQGATATAQGEWTYEVHHLAEGLDLYRDALSWSPFQNHTHALAAGQALARLHQAAAHYDAPRRHTQVLLANARLIEQSAPLEAIANLNSAYLADKDWQVQLSELMLPWHRALHPLLAEQPPLWTHNDWHASNLLWASEGSVSSVLDFGLADRTFALFDLATAIERNAVPWLELDTGGVARADLDSVDALLTGYHQARPLSAKDLHTLSALLPLVHVDFALSEVAYYQDVVGSTASADVAYYAYLLGHLRWFAGPQGQRLLDHIRRTSV
ncbi:MULTISPECIES: phosphotransferase [Pseudomonas]|uniref:Homoserine kinase n=2 Tax=Pseudomonas TaxID=286 RepID=A0A5M9IV34_9PSED|nr:MULTISPECIES: phosphotransferase [Pseudomonas]KAA6175616.1 phosphotransferase [Pseudomonas veronii]KAA6183616.1 phosphotransferase [Pseudomonas veronii]KAA8559556.1 Homoserine kinase [Pseudomonas extremaustralis]